MITDINDAIQWARDSKRTFFVITEGGSSRSPVIDQIPRNYDENVDPDEVYEELAKQLEVHTRHGKTVCLRSYSDDKKHNLRKIQFCINPKKTTGISGINYGIDPEVAINGGVKGLVEKEVTRALEMQDMKNQIEALSQEREPDGSPMAQIGNACINAITTASAEGTLPDLIGSIMQGAANMMAVMKMKQSGAQSTQQPMTGTPTAVMRLMNHFHGQDELLEKLADFVDTDPVAAKNLIKTL